MIIFVGYIVTLSYVAFLIFGLGSILLKYFGKEISRKVIHTSLFALWFFVDLFFKLTIHQIIIPFLFLIINIVSYKFKLFRQIERSDNNSPGTIYFAIAVLAIAAISYFVPETYDYVYYGVAALTIGDGLASIFGYLIKSKKIYNQKTIAGSIACFVGTLVALIPYYFVKNQPFPFWNLITISMLVTLLELFGYGLDNLTVTFCSFAMGYLCFKLGIDFQIGLAIGTSVFFLVFICNLITYFGSLLSGFIAFSFYYFGGYKSLLFLFSCYVVSVICLLINRKMRKNEQIVKKVGKKDLIQIFVNGFIPTFYIILSFALKNHVFAIVSYIGLTANLVDSVSSDIGVLSKQRPFDIIRFKHIDSGLSGGVSLLGTLSASLVSISYSFIIMLLFELKYWSVPVVFALIMSGTIIDSILGSTVQIKYECSVCHIVTEKDVHCDTKCTKCSGLKFVNNDVVNLLSSLTSTSAGLLMFLVV